MGALLIAEGRLIAYSGSLRGLASLDPAGRTSLRQRLLGRGSLTPLVDRPRSLILESPSRFGKTEWARSLGPHMYFNHLFNLDDWRDDALYIIFDDFEWQFIPAKKCFLGAQKMFSISDKYRKKRTVKFGKPCIVLTNILPVLTTWEAANTVTVRLNKQLF